MDSVGLRLNKNCSSGIMRGYQGSGFAVLNLNLAREICLLRFARFTVSDGGDDCSTPRSEIALFKSVGWRIIRQQPKIRDPELLASVALTPAETTTMAITMKSIQNDSN